jgi:hypothetical protein
MTTEILSFRGTKFEVQTELNAEIYSVIESDSEFLRRTNNDQIVSLYIDHRDRFLSNELITFLRQAGVDHDKDNEIYHYEIDSTVIISGWFDIIGKILGAHRTETFVLDNGDSTLNFRFSHDETYGIRSELEPHPTFRLSFDLVLH